MSFTVKFPLRVENFDYEEYKYRVFILNVVFKSLSNSAHEDTAIK